jgi:hypothetical protein
MATELGETGKLIWAALKAETLDASSQALVRELARCADTLDRLDGLATGRREEWAVLTFDEMGEVHLSVDKILDVRRSHQLAFKALFAEVKAAGIKADEGSSSNSKDEEPEDMLAKLRRQKESRESPSG